MEHSYGALIPTVRYYVERQCLPDWKIRSNIMPLYDLTYIYKGKAVYILNDEPLSLREGEFVFVRKGMKRQAYTFAENPMHCFAFNFDYTVLDGEQTELPFPSVFSVEDDYELVEAFREFGAVWLEKSDGYMLKARAIFMLILHRLISLTLEEKQGEIKDKRIQRVKDYILKNYHKKITLDELAMLVDLNPVYLGTMFNKKTGLTIKEYTNSLRVRAAETLLAAEGYSVAEAAYRCGFDDPFYFSKVFKRIKGKPPSYYMNKH